jgi:hypothetical protein
MAAVRRQPFNGGNVLARDFTHGDAAGTHRALADQHRAGTALLNAAAVLGSGQADRVSQRPEQRCLRLQVQGVLLSIDA